MLPLCMCGCTYARGRWLFIGTRDSHLSGSCHVGRSMSLRVWTTGHLIGDCPPTPIPPSLVGLLLSLLGPLLSSSLRFGNEVMQGLVQIFFFTDFKSLIYSLVNPARSIVFSFQTCLWLENRASHWKVLSLLESNNYNPRGKKVRPLCKI